MNLTLRETSLAMSPFVILTAWTLWGSMLADSSPGQPEAFDGASTSSCPSSWVFSLPSEGRPRVALRWQGDDLDIESIAEVQGTGCPACDIEARFDEGPIEVFSVREVNLTRLEVIQADWFTQSFLRSARVELVLRLNGTLQKVSFETSSLEVP